MSQPTPITPKKKPELGFDESDGIDSLKKFGVIFLVVGLLLVFFGASGFVTSDDESLGFLITTLIGASLTSFGWLYLILGRLGEGIAYRIGKHLNLHMQEKND